MFEPNKLQRNTELFIFDIYVAIVKIKKVSNEFNYAQNLLHDFRSWDSIIREFEIIGEASKYLLKEDLLDKQYQEIVDFRNHITHEYFGIDCDIVWLIAHNELYIFEKIILSLIENIEASLKNELIDAYLEDNKYLNFVVDSLKVLRHA